MPEEHPSNLATEEELLRHIGKVWDDFQTKYIHNSLTVPLELRSAIHLNSRLLVEAVKDARVDLQRMVEWHLRDKSPDRHKYAAFLAKWIAKVRPIYIDEGVAFDASKHFINAEFALWIFRSFLTHKIPLNLRDYLRYMFHFRDERGETLSLIAYCCERISELEEQNQSYTPAG